MRRRAKYAFSVRRGLPAGPLSIAGLIGVLLAALGAFGTAASAAAAPKAAHKSPISLFLIDDVTIPSGATPTLPAFQMAVAGANARGGANGHVIKLTVCDSASSSAKALACAQQAVASHASAVITYSTNGGSYESVLQSAGIPDIGGDLLFTALNLSSPASFPVSGGGIVSTNGYAAVGKKLGCKRMSYVADAPAAYASVIQLSVSTFDTQAARFGIKTGPAILATPGSPDFTPEIASAAAQGSDCMILQPLSSDLVAMVNAARSATTNKIIMSNGLFNQNTVNSLGSKLNGIYTDDLSWPLTSASGHPGVVQFLHDLHKYGPTYSSTIVSTATSVTEANWAAVQLFAYAAGRVKQVNATDMLRFLNRLNKYDPGIAPPVSFGRPSPAVRVGARMFQPNAVIGHFVGDKQVPYGFYNIGSGAKVAFPSTVEPLWVTATVKKKK